MNLSYQHIMANSSLSLFLLFVLFLGHGVFKLEASHCVYRNGQIYQSMSTNQPYRTGYHFQPPKNWMNGTFFSFCNIFLICT